MNNYLINDLVCFQVFEYAAFFYKQHFYKQHQTEIGKKFKWKLSIALMLNFCYLKIICFFHSRHHPKIIGHILKKCAKSKCLYFNEIIGSIMIKVKEKTDHIKYGINRSASRHGLTYTKCKKFLSMMKVIRINQHPTNTS